MKSWFGLAARLVVGAVLVIAGAAKIPDPAGSVRAVRAYQLLPESLVPAVGYGLPAVEIALGLLLIAGLFTRTAALASAVLFAVFVAGIASVWVRGLSIECGCFGGGGANANAAGDYPWEIARDLGLMFLAGWLVVRPKSRWSADSLVTTQSLTA